MVEVTFEKGYNKKACKYAFFMHEKGVLYL